MKPIYGIDLGTTFTKCAVWEDNQVSVLKLDVELHAAQGAKPVKLAGLRSAVTLTEERSRPVSFVGTVAFRESKRLKRAKVENVLIEEAKNWIGTNLEVTGGLGGPPWYLGAKDYRPEDIGALVLRAVSKAVEASGRERVERAVITHPAQFDSQQQRATRDAAMLAGIEVVDLLTEPEAAAIAYSQSIVHNDGRYLIFDLGGGTLDLVLIDIRNRTFQTRGKDGIKLAGKDFDRIVFDAMVANVKSQTSDIFDAGFLTDWDERVWMAIAENTKKALNFAPGEGPERVRASIPYDSDYAMEVGLIQEPFPAQFEFSYGREEFEGSSQRLIQEIEARVQQFLDNERVRWEDLTGVLLVGGSARLVGVRRMLERASGSPGKLIQTLDTDTVVVQGAALHAESLRVRSAGQQEEQAGLGALVQRTPYRSRLYRSVGVLVEDSQGNRRVVRLVNKETSTPLDKPVEKQFTTARPRQDHIKLELYEGEGTDPDDGEATSYIGDAVIPIDRPTEELQKVVVRLYIEGNDTKRVQVLVGGQEKEVEIKFDPARIMDNAERAQRLDHIRQVEIRHG